MKDIQIDVDDRRPIWDVFQMFWMDIDPELELETTVFTCATSKYELTELEHIYWNEVYPAVAVNLSQPIPEWTGYDIDILSELIVTSAKSQSEIKYKWLHPSANKWWKRIAEGIMTYRAAE